MSKEGVVQNRSFREGELPVLKEVVLIKHKHLDQRDYYLYWLTLGLSGLI